MDEPFYSKMLAADLALLDRIGDEVFTTENLPPLQPRPRSSRDLSPPPGFNDTPVPAPQPPAVPAETDWWE